MKPHESPRINKKSIRGDSGDSRPVWNRGISQYTGKRTEAYCGQFVIVHRTKVLCIMACLLVHDKVYNKAGKLFNDLIMVDVTYADY